MLAQPDLSLSSFCKRGEENPPRTKKHDGVRMAEKTDLNKSSYQWWEPWDDSPETHHVPFDDIPRQIADPSSPPVVVDRVERVGEVFKIYKGLYLICECPVDLVLGRAAPNPPQGLLDAPPVIQGDYLETKYTFQYTSTGGFLPENHPMRVLEDVGYLARCRTMFLHQSVFAYLDVHIGINDMRRDLKKAGYKACDSVVSMRAWDYCAQSIRFDIHNSTFYLSHDTLSDVLIDMVHLKTGERVAYNGYTVPRGRTLGSLFDTPNFPYILTTRGLLGGSGKGKKFNKPAGKKQSKSAVRKKGFVPDKGGVKQNIKPPTDPVCTTCGKRHKGFCGEYFWFNTRFALQYGVHVTSIKCVCNYTGQKVEGGFACICSCDDPDCCPVCPSDFCKKNENCGCFGLSCCGFAKLGNNRFEGYNKLKDGDKFPINFCSDHSELDISCEMCYGLMEDIPLALAGLLHTLKDLNKNSIADFQNFRFGREYRVLYNIPEGGVKWIKWLVQYYELHTKNKSLVSIRDFNPMVSRNQLFARPQHPVAVVKEKPTDNIFEKKEEVVEFEPNPELEDGDEHSAVDVDDDIAEDVPVESQGTDNVPKNIGGIHDVVSDLMTNLRNLKIEEEDIEDKSETSEDEEQPIAEVELGDRSSRNSDSSLNSTDLLAPTDVSNAGPGGVGNIQGDGGDYSCESESEVGSTETENGGGEVGGCGINEVKQGCKHSLVECLAFGTGAAGALRDCCGETLVELRKRLESKDYQDAVLKESRVPGEVEAEVGFEGLFAPVNFEVDYSKIFSSTGFKIPHLERPGDALVCHRIAYWLVFILGLVVLGVQTGLFLFLGWYFIFTFWYGWAIIPMYSIWLVVWCIALKATFSHKQHKIHNTIYLNLNTLLYTSLVDKRPESMRLGTKVYVKKWVPMSSKIREWEEREGFAKLAWVFRYFVSPVLGVVPEQAVNRMKIDHKNGVCLESLSQVLTCGIIKPFGSIEVKIASTERAVSRLTCVNLDRFSYLKTESDHETVLLVASAYATNCYRHQAAYSPFRRALAKRMTPTSPLATVTSLTYLKQISGLIG